jgi:hypothetical protein
MVDDGRTIFLAECALAERTRLPGDDALIVDGDGGNVELILCAVAEEWSLPAFDHEVTADAQRLDTDKLCSHTERGPAPAWSPRRPIVASYP